MSMPLRPPLASTSAPGPWRRVAALACALFAGPALAEHWVDALPATRGALLQWDSDSVVTAGANRIDAVWRTGTAPGRPYFLKRGVVDCAAQSLQVSTSTWVEARPGGADPGGAVTDYAAGTRTRQSRTTRLTAAERAEGSEFPSPGDAAGRLVQLLCAEAAGPPALPEADSANSQRDTACANSPTSASAPCPDALRLLDLRLAQARQACALSIMQIRDLRTLALVPVADCTSPVADCQAQPLRTALAGLGTDLARAATGQACLYVPEALERLTRAAEERAASARFQACAARSIPALDDRVSQADVVARGVFGACRSELPSEIAQGPAFENGLLPGLTAAVLEYRSSRRAVLPAKPSRSPAD